MDTICMHGNRAVIRERTPQRAHISYQRFLDWIDLSQKGETVYGDKGYFGSVPFVSIDNAMYQAVSRTRSLVERPFAVIIRICHAGLAVMTTHLPDPYEKSGLLLLLQPLQHLLYPNCPAAALSSSKKNKKRGFAVTDIQDSLPHILDCFWVLGYWYFEKI